MGHEAILNEYGYAHTVIMEIEVEDIFKGPAYETVYAITAVDSGACGLGELPKNRRYIFNLNYMGGDNWFVGICDPPIWLEREAFYYEGELVLRSGPALLAEFSELAEPRKPEPRLVGPHPLAEPVPTPPPETNLPKTGGCTPSQAIELSAIGLLVTMVGVGLTLRRRSKSGV